MPDLARRVRVETAAVAGRLVPVMLECSIPVITRTTIPILAPETEVCGPSAKPREAGRSVDAPRLAVGSIEGQPFGMVCSAAWMTGAAAFGLVNRFDVSENQ